MTFRLAMRAVVAAPADRVFAYLTDLQPDDHDRPAFRRGAGIPPDAKKRSTRRILHKSEDQAEVEDSWQGRRMRLRVAWDPRTREIVIVGERGYRAVWRTLPDGAGTRIEADVTMDPGGLFGLLLPLFKKGIRRQLEQDFRGHVNDVTEALTVRVSR